MSNIFYTADGRKINLENFGDTQSTPSTDDIFNKSLKEVVSFNTDNEKKNLKVKGKLQADSIETKNGIILPDKIYDINKLSGPVILAGLDLEGKPQSLIIHPTSGTVLILGNTRNLGTITANEFLNADGSNAGLPKNVSFDANGNMVFDGTITAKKYLNADGFGCCIN